MLVPQSVWPRAVEVVTVPVAGEDVPRRALARLWQRPFTNERTQRFKLGLSITRCDQGRDR